jgi:hypothetical protein
MSDTDREADENSLFTGEMARGAASFSVGSPVVSCSLPQRIISPCLFVTQQI